MRVRLGASLDSAPELLATLATDPAVTVRAAVALNSAAPARANHILAHDGDTRVRALLARKLASLVPEIGDPERDRLQQHALRVLHELVNDEAMRVRAAIAEVLKDMPQAPREIILKLAHDSEVPVSEPVIRLSPLLTTEDLLGLLAASPHPAAATAVALRRGLPAEVSDVLASGTDTEAIRALLTNHTAAIREATLDALIARAQEQPGWHAPLIRRPRLSAAAAYALSEYVATHLLDELSGRADLTPECTTELRRRLHERLLPLPAKCACRAPNIDESMGVARALAYQGQLDEAALLGTLQRGEARLATAILAVAAGVPASVVDRAATLRSAKALVSLVWRAGFSMQVAGPLQALLARIAPEDALRAGPGGTFPLAVEEMRWQLDFLTRMER
jgi:uncharacterized protein (DUF2336 family)